MNRLFVQISPQFKEKFEASQSTNKEEKQEFANDYPVSVSASDKVIQNSGHNFIKQEFRIILNGLLPFGQCPLGYDDELGQFSWRWRSTRTYLAAGCLLLTLLAVSAHILKFVYPSYWKRVLGYPHDLEKLGRKDKNGASDFTSNEVLLISIPYHLIALSYLLDAILGWARAQDLAHYLNRWTQFYTQYDQLFPDHRPSTQMKQSDQKPVGIVSLFRWEARGRLFRMWMSMVLCIALVSCLMFNVVRGFVRKLPIEYTLFLISESYRAYVYTLILDVLHVSMYNHVTEAFWKIRQQLEKRSEFGEDSLFEDEHRFRELRALIDLARDQCVLLSKYQTPGQLLFLVKMVITTTFLVFGMSLLNWKKQYDGVTATNFAYAWSCMILLLLTQMFAKCSRAEEITTEETALFDQLTKMRVSYGDTPRKRGVANEVHLLLSSMAKTPSCVNLGKFVVLNRRLLLGVLGHVVTYLIVLKQFAQK